MGPTPRQSPRKSRPGSEVRGGRASILTGQTGTLGADDNLLKAAEPLGLNITLGGDEVHQYDI